MTVFEVVILGKKYFLFRIQVCITWVQFPPLSGHRKYSWCQFLLQDNHQYVFWFDFQIFEFSFLQYKTWKLKKSLKSHFFPFPQKHKAFATVFIRTFDIINMLLPFNFKYIIKRNYSCLRYSLLNEGCMGLPCTFLCFPSVEAT